MWVKESSWWQKAVESYQQKCSLLLPAIPLKLLSCSSTSVLHFKASPSSSGERYFLPIKKKKDEKLWYCAVPLGQNTLDKKLKEIFALANLDLDGNHSLHAASISRMYYANIPERLIMERSGHLSKEGVCSYD